MSWFEKKSGLQFGQICETWCVDCFKTIMWHISVHKQQMNEQKRWEKTTLIEQTNLWGMSLIPMEEDLKDDCCSTSWRYKRWNEWWD